MNLKLIKYSATALCALAVVGIVTLMILARNKDEDIAGIVAMGLLGTLVSGTVAIVATVMEKRARKSGDLK